MSLSASLQFVKDSLMVPIARALISVALGHTHLFQHNNIGEHNVFVVVIHSDEQSDNVRQKALCVYACVFFVSGSECFTMFNISVQRGTKFEWRLFLFLSDVDNADSPSTHASSGCLLSQNCYS